ncbi:hypothetical protein CLV98_111122 [Dyadobacter jejuensis]|uniref:Uncharacterized protein n=1 Tax=Dyadobacter jejuensis TaxID=1082580 RepID=A0A316AH76_9BACT|nr:hypothetical protein CLV98_111122 [Dyadobacter jejuensis]
MKVVTIIWPWASELIINAGVKRPFEAFNFSMHGVLGSYPLRFQQTPQQNLPIQV